MMTPLEAARRMNDECIWYRDDDGASVCIFCGTDDDEHMLNCPWPVMPQIIAALEAAYEASPHYVIGHTHDYPCCLGTDDMDRSILGEVDDLQAV